MGRIEKLTTKEIEIVLEIEKNIDVDKARQFFKHVMRNDQFEEDLDNSQSDICYDFFVQVLYLDTSPLWLFSSCYDF